MELQRINIDNLIPGMQNVDIIGVAGRISKREFSTDKAEGKVANIVLNDDTGSIRLVLWNDEIEHVAGLQEGDLLRVVGYVRQGLFGSELRLGRFGKIDKQGRASRRTTIAELKEGQKKEVRAAIVQLFESNPFYEICPTCGLTVKEDKDNYVCITHGQVDPAYALHISGILDDGTENIRCVMFKQQAETILGMNAERAKDIVLRKGMPALFASARLGEYIFEGQIRRNKLFDRLEFIVNKILLVDVTKEIESFLESDKPKIEI